MSRWPQRATAETGEGRVQSPGLSAEKTFVQPNSLDAKTLTFFPED
jgi:hypothetical protein